MTLISHRRPHTGSDISPSYAAFLFLDHHILTRSMSAPSSTKINKPLVAVVVLASSFVLGVFICITFHLRSRHNRNVARNRPPSIDTRRETRHLTSDIEMSKVASDTQTLNETSSSWVPPFKLFRSRHLTPEPFTLTQPSLNARSPSTPTSPVTPVVIVERFPPPTSTSIDGSSIRDQKLSPRSPASPPAYLPSETSSVSRALPTPPSSPRSPRTPPISKKKMEIAVGGGYVSEVVQSPPPAYNRDRPMYRAATTNVTRPPRRALPRRPSTGPSPLPLTPLVSPSSPTTASSSRRVLSMALQADNKRLPRLMTVAQTFLPTFPDEVSVRSGDAVLLLEEYGDSWCLVQLLATSAARRGVVPRSCLTDYVDSEDDSQ